MNKLKEILRDIIILYIFQTIVGITVYSIISTIKGYDFIILVIGSALFMLIWDTFLILIPTLIVNRKKIYLDCFPSRSIRKAREMVDKANVQLHIIRSNRQLRRIRENIPFINGMKMNGHMFLPRGYGKTLMYTKLMEEMMQFPQSENNDTIDASGNLTIPDNSEEVEEEETITLTTDIFTPDEYAQSQGYINSIDYENNTNIRVTEIPLKIQESMIIISRITGATINRIYIERIKQICFRMINRMFEVERFSNNDRIEVTFSSQDFLFQRERNFLEAIEQATEPQTVQQQIMDLEQQIFSEQARQAPYILQELRSRYLDSVRNEQTPQAQEYLQGSRDLGIIPIEDQEVYGSYISVITEMITTLYENRFERNLRLYLSQIVIRQIMINMNSHTGITEYEYITNHFHNINLEIIEDNTLEEVMVLQAEANNGAPLRAHVSTGALIGFEGEIPQAQPQETKEFVINELITVKLESKDKLTSYTQTKKELETNIYIAGRKFRQCKYLLLNLDTSNKKLMKEQQEIESIDDAAKLLSRENEHNKNILTPEEEFVGHCSNLVAWAENNYNPCVLHSNLSFPLLKELIKHGDKKALIALKEEIMRRFEKDAYRTIETHGGIIDKYFSKEERDLIEQRIIEEIKALANELEYSNLTIGRLVKLVKAFDGIFHDEMIKQGVSISLDDLERELEDDLDLEDLEEFDIEDIFDDD